MQYFRPTRFAIHFLCLFYEVEITRATRVLRVRNFTLFPQREIYSCEQFSKIGDVMGRASYIMICQMRKKKESAIVLGIRLLDDENRMKTSFIEVC